MKIPSLLAQYLYGNQRLDLPGIGTFLLDSSAMFAAQNARQRSAILEGVIFECNPSLREAPELITFIAEKTGKMKSLASADLDSHLLLAQQFLNMGKPFSFEGIGILTRIKPGELEFTPITVSTEKIKEHQKSEISEAATNEESAKYESFLSGPISKFEWRKPVIGLFLICGIGFTIWGGYVISKRNNNHPIDTSAQKLITETTVSDSLQNVDSLPASQALLAAAPDNYKYVLETAKQKRALKRYHQLRDIRWNVELETQDSIQYKIIMLLPAIADTSRTLDSLTVMTGRKVYIEYPN